MQEAPYVATHPLYPSRYYSPLMLGQTTAATCPTRSYWWLALAAAAGGWAGWQYSKTKKRGRRR